MPLQHLAKRYVRGKDQDDIIIILEQKSQQAFNLAVLPFNLSDFQVHISHYWQYKQMPTQANGSLPISLGEKALPSSQSAMQGTNEQGCVLPCWTKRHPP